MSDSPNTSTENTSTENTSTQSTSTENTGQPAELQTIAKAAEGLMFQSESDVAFTPFFWEATEPQAPTAEIVAGFIDIPAAEIKSKSVAAVLKPMTAEEDWHNDAEKAEVQRFRELVKTIDGTLKHAKAFRTGDVQVDIYIVGCVATGYAGLKTQAVET